MQKIYSILFASLLSLLCLDANAFTMFVEIDNPANLASLEKFCGNEGKTAINTYGEMPLTVEFPEDGSRYFYVTPASGCYITEFVITDEDGNVLSEKNGAWKSMQLVTIKPEYDYGTLYIKTSATQPKDAKMTVNLKGNPSSVSMYLGGSRQVQLQEGSQEIEFSSYSEGTVYLMPVKVNKFYRVMLDGNEIPGNGTSSEDGVITHQYTLSVKNNSVIDIEIDYPDVSIDCSITLNEGLKGFIQKVTLDGVPVDDWTKFQARMGSKLLIVGNTYDYDIDKFSINGENHNFTAGTWEAIVEKELAFNINGSAIERPYTATVITYNWNYIGNESKGFYRYEFMRSDNKSITLNNGENTVRFNSKEVPLSLFVGADNPGDIHVVINGGEELIPDQNATYHLALKDGDVVQIALATDVPDIPTTIDFAVAPTNDKNIGFNLAGQKVSTEYRGIIVKKGKKLIKK